jgi:hypothetical protein
MKPCNSEILHSNLAIGCLAILQTKQNKTKQNTKHSIEIHPPLGKPKNGLCHNENCKSH